MFLMLFGDFALAIWSVAVGAFLCAVYDVFRLFRLRRKQNAVLLFVSDLTFCTIAALSMLLLFFNLSYGRMRAYSFVLAFVGFLIWRFTVSRFVMAFMLKLINAVCKLLNSIKMRVIRAYKRMSCRIYTVCYCKTAVADIKKRKEQEYDTKKTDARQSDN